MARTKRAARTSISKKKGADAHPTTAKNAPHHGRAEMMKKQKSSRRRSSLLNMSLSNMKISTEDDASGVTRKTSSSSLDTEESLAIDAMLAQLTKDELETAARGSYEYLSSTRPDMSAEKFARPMARRFLQAKDGNKDLALDRMRRTLQFRETMNVPALMRAFDYGDKNESGNDDDDIIVSKKAAVVLEKRLSSKHFYVHGRDKDGRSTVVFVPRRTPAPDAEWTLKEALYSMERAIACTKSEDGTINAVVDFSGFRITQHSPPPDIGKAFLTALRHHYAGQVHRIYILNVPRSFWCLWNIFKGFVGTNTKDKIVFVPGNRAKCEATADAQYERDELPFAWRECLQALSGKGSGKNKDSDDFDIDLNQYLWKVPFDEAK